MEVDEVKSASGDANAGPSPPDFKKPAAPVHLVLKKRPPPTAPAQLPVVLEDAPAPVSVPTPAPGDAQVAKKLRLPQPTEPSETTDSPAYVRPAWDAVCQGDYSILVLKNGVEVATVALRGASWLLIGRQSDCQLRMEHPSLSRHHAVLQFSDGCLDPRYPAGWYLIDLGSTHGTLVNKARLPPNQYQRLRVGHVVKPAGSSRLLVLQGPDEDMEAESDLSYTQLKERRDRRRLLQQQKLTKQASLSESAGCTWGQAEDATEEEPEPEAEAAAARGRNGLSRPNATAVAAGAGSSAFPQHEDAYMLDPQKFLRAWYDRQGLEPPLFKFDAENSCCRLELPVDDADGRPLIAEAAALPGQRRREVLTEVALTACRLLDRLGEFDDAEELASGSSRERRLRELAENDFYEEEEDAFFDRTGQLEGRRRARMRLLAAMAGDGGGAGGPAPARAATFEELAARCRQLGEEIADIEGRLQASARVEQELKRNQDTQQQQMDMLEEYMRTIRAGGLDQQTRTRLKLRLMEARKEETLARRMMEKARPADLSSVGAATRERERRLGERPESGQRQPRQPQMRAFDGEEFDEEEEAVAESQDKDPQQDVDLKNNDSDVGSTSNLNKDFSINKDKDSSVNKDKDSSVNKDKDSSANKDKESSANKDKDSIYTKDKDSVSKDQDQGDPAPRAATSSLWSAPLKLRASTSASAKAKAPVQRPAWLDDGESEGGPSAFGGRRIGPRLEPEAPTTEVLAAAAEPPSLPPPPPPPPPPPAHQPKRRPRRPQQGEGEGYDASNPDYALWLPPDDQSGDGATELNRKLGY